MLEMEACYSVLVVHEDRYECCDDYSAKQAAKYCQHNDYATHQYSKRMDSTFVQTIVVCFGLEITLMMLRHAVVQWRNASKMPRRKDSLFEARYSEIAAR
jgi:hypothetical protein